MSRRDAKISALMRQRLGDVAAPQYQTTGPNDLPTQKTVGEVIVDAVLDQALQKKEWALRFVAEYSEGKPGVQEKSGYAGAETDERLSDVTAHHLNSLAIGVGTKPPPPTPAIAATSDPAGGDGSPASNAPTGLAAKLLALPKNRSIGPKNQGREPAVPAEAAGSHG